MKEAWFTDDASQREGKVWFFKSAAIKPSTREQIVNQDKGSAQAGELYAGLNVFIKEKAAKEAVFIYTDSFAVLKGLCGMDNILGK